LEALGVIVRQKRSKGRYGRSSDLTIINLHRRFDIGAKEVQAANRKLAAQSSNRKKLILPTGSPLPGNTKRITYPLIQGGNLSGLGTDGGYRTRPALAVVNGAPILPYGEDDL
jgi:hypothetical protein